MSVWIARKLAFCCVCVLLCWDPRACELKKNASLLLLRNASFLYTHRFTYPPTRTVSFKKSSTHRFNARAETINPFCLLRVLFMSQNAKENGAHAEAVKTEHQRYAVHCNGYFHSHGFCFFSQLPVAECIQSPSMLRPIRLQCRSPTHQPALGQNRAQQLITANLVGKTKRKDPLCSTNARAHLLSAWVIVAATPHLCIHR